ncbi:MAG: MFS transporter, partial [Salinibacterium sp.]|nr:MFS transporter [Salinibacterium sp.]
VLLAALIYIPANVTYQIGENFLASFLPGVSTPRTIGRISALGWAMGYAGALVLLVISIGLMLTMGWESPAMWRPFFIFAGVWFAINMIPALLCLHEPPIDRSVRQASNSQSLLVDAIARLRNTIASAKQYRQLGRFFLAFFIFGMGVQVIIAFASILASDFGITGTGLVIYVGQITITAGLAAVVTGLYQDRLGARTTVIVFLVVWVASALALLAISLLPTKPQWAFWLVGNGLGIGIGGIGTASRSLVGRFTPAHKTAEFFGLWGMVYKAAGVAGVASFGQVKAWIGMPASLGLLSMFFVVGLVLLLRVNETAGLRAARRTERDAIKGHGPPSASAEQS